MVAPIQKELPCLAANEITAATNTNDGASYAANEIITLTGGTGTGAKVKVLTVSGGNILTYEINEAGTGYTAGDALTQASTTGSGTGATFEVTDLVSYSDVIELDRAGPFMVSFLANGAGTMSAAAEARPDDSTAVPLSDVTGTEISGITSDSCKTVCSPCNRVRAKNTGDAALVFVVNY
jgi:hypothetical protein